MIMSTTHKPQRVENYMSEPGTVVHLKVKISKEFLWLSSLTNAQVHTGRYIWASRLGGLRGSHHREGVFSWVMLVDESKTPDLCAQGLRSELLAWKRGSIERTVGLPMLKLASGIFSICTWCWAGVHENPQKGMFPSWMREEGEKK